MIRIVIETRKHFGQQYSSKENSCNQFARKESLLLSNELNLFENEINVFIFIVRNGMVGWRFMAFPISEVPVKNCVYFIFISSILGVNWININLL